MGILVLLDIYIQWAGHQLMVLAHLDRIPKIKSGDTEMQRWTICFDHKVNKNSYNTLQSTEKFILNNLQYEIYEDYLKDMEYPGVGIINISIHIFIYNQKQISRW